MVIVGYDVTNTGYHFKYRLLLCIEFCYCFFSTMSRHKHCLYLCICLILIDCISFDAVSAVFQPYGLLSSCCHLFERNLFNGAFHLRRLAGKLGNGNLRYQYRQPAKCFQLTATLAMLAISVLPVKLKAPLS